MYSTGRHHVGPLFFGGKIPIMAPSCQAPRQTCMFVLRPYQTDAVNAVISHFRKHPDPAVVVLPTGPARVW